MQVLGEHRGLVKLDLVQPNNWNMNEMTEAKYAALLYSLKQGWEESEPLLIWGKDNRGKVRNVIIDGEHRWKGARELGLKQGPMVFLDGIDRAKAIELTIKLDNKRGAPEKGERLVKALREVLPTLKVDPALVLGFTQAEVDKLLEPVKPNLNPLVSQNAAAKMMPLYFTPAEHEQFLADVARLRDVHGFESVTDAVVFAVLHPRYAN